MKCPFFVIVGMCFCGCLLAAENFDLSALKEQVNNLVKTEASRELTVSNCKPDKRITSLMGEIDSIGQKLMSQENQSDDVMELSEKCLAILSALRERRVYAYMLWAEGRLEGASRGRYANLKSLSQSDLIKLYEFLSDINISIIRENMLNREIMSKLAEIYDCLDNSNKPTVRIKAIQQQRDPLSNVTNVPIRKSLDDF
jgi:hypothetical protein